MISRILLLHTSTGLVITMLEPFVSKSLFYASLFVMNDELIHLESNRSYETLQVDQGEREGAGKR